MEQLKTQEKKEIELSQLLYRTGTWKRLLLFMRDENIQMKNRLSEILRGKFNKDRLEEAEYFQNLFIKEDERIGLLRNDIAAMDKLMMHQCYEFGNISEATKRGLESLGHNIKIVQEVFTELMAKFNEQLP